MGQRDEALFSRSGTTSAEGKMTSRVDIPVPVALEEKLMGLAALADRPKAEYARMLLTKAVEGELAYLRSIGVAGGHGDGNNAG